VTVLSGANSDPGGGKNILEGCGTFRSARSPRVCEYSVALTLDNLDLYRPESKTATLVPIPEYL